VSNGLWSNAGSWTAGVPTDATQGTWISNGGTCTYDSSAGTNYFTSNYMQVGRGDGPGRLHHKSLSQKDFFEVGFIPTSGEAFVLNVPLNYWLIGLASV